MSPPKQHPFSSSKIFSPPHNPEQSINADSQQFPKLSSEFNSEGSQLSVQSIILLPLQTPEQS